MHEYHVSCLLDSRTMLLMNRPNTDTVFSCCHNAVSIAFVTIVSHCHESSLAAKAYTASMELQRETHLLSVVLCDAVA